MNLRFDTLRKITLVILYATPFIDIVNEFIGSNGKVSIGQIIRTLIIIFSLTITTAMMNNYKSRKWLPNDN